MILIKSLLLRMSLLLLVLFIFNTANAQVFKEPAHNGEVKDVYEITFINEVIVTGSSFIASPNSDGLKMGRFNYVEFYEATMTTARLRLKRRDASVEQTIELNRGEPKSLKGYNYAEVEIFFHNTANAIGNGTVRFFKDFDQSVSNITAQVEFPATLTMNTSDGPIDVQGTVNIGNVDEFASGQLPTVDAQMLIEIENTVVELVNVNTNIQNVQPRTGNFTQNIPEDGLPVSNSVLNLLQDILKTMQFGSAVEVQSVELTTSPIAITFNQVPKAVYVYAVDSDINLYPALIPVDANTRRGVSRNIFHSLEYAPLAIQAEAIGATTTVNFWVFF